MSDQVYECFLTILKEWAIECEKLLNDPKTNMMEYSALKKKLLERKLQEYEIMMT